MLFAGIYIMTRLEKCEFALKKGFVYNSLNGIITSTNGKVIQRISNNGYVRVPLFKDGKRHTLTGHQFAWYYTYKEIVECLDHIDRNKTNNSINNLRSVSKSQNAFNMNNVKGYFYSKRDKKYIAQIMVNYKKKQLGTFNTSEEARNCYLENKIKYHIIN